MEHVFATTDKMSEVIQNMQKCLQCIICLHTISEPVRTRCGHRFCRECIQRLLQSTNATCPLCNSVLHRRTVSKDEHMEMHINRLEKLIEAIQTDSGIDISLHVSRPRSACESNSSVPIEKPKYDQQDHAVPSCSKANKPSFRRRSDTNSNSKSQNSKTMSKKSRDRKDSAKGSDITKYLSKFISGVEPLPPDEPTYGHNDSTNRVQSWLETLPDNEVLDDPNKALQLPTECNLHDTLTYSISQNHKENKIDKFTADDTVAGKLDDNNESNERDAKHRRLYKESRKEGSNDEVGNSRGEYQKSSEPRKIRSKVNKIDKFTADDTVAGKLDDNNESNERDAKHRRLSKESRKEGSNDEVGNSRGECQKSCEPRKTRSKVNQMELNCDDQEPSTSGICRLKDDDNEKSAHNNAHNQDKLNDIHRTSPNDMLPAMKKNWSSVVKFGKEMRTKKKKLKSLNVSIENKNKSLSRASLKETVSISGTTTKSNKKRKGNRADTSKVVANADKHRLEESLQNIESARVREEPSPTSQDNRSKSDYVPPAGESSFIMLEEGEQVHIRNLNSYQMNDIIGIADSVEDREKAEIENVQDNGDPEGNTLSLEKRGRISKIQDRSESPLQVTPAKRTIEDSPGEANDSVPIPADKRASLSEVKKVDATEESTFRFQSSVVSQTPSHNRLSLRRRSTESKSNESPSVDPASRLLAVKRDLYRQLDQNEGKRDNGSDVVQVAIETNVKSEGNSRKENRDVKGVSLGSRGSSASDGSVGRKRRSEEQDRHLVTFRKLGKVVKQRKKPVTFLYLGSTRHSCNHFVKLAKMYSSTQLEVNVPKFDAREKDSDSNTRITLDDSVTKAQDGKNKDDALMEKVKGRTEVRREESSFDQPGSSTNKVTDTLRINMYRESKSKQASPITDIAESKSEGSDDVLLVSLYDNEEKVPPRVERDECRSKSSVTEKTSKDTVRIISPKKDSQFKSLWLNSPTTDSAKVSDIAQQSEVTKDNSAKKSNFSDIRGAHSRALIRKSQQAFEISEPSSSSTPKKRKRSPIRENLTHRLKRKSEEGREDPIEESASDSESIESKATYVIDPNLGAKEAAVIARTGDNEMCQIASSTVNEEESMIANFDTDTDDPKCIEAQKRTYRRVISLVSSDTDSSSNRWLACSKTNANVSATGDEIATSSTIKRKRTLSSDSDETDVNVIVKSWYTNYSSTDKCTKKGKVEPSRVSGLKKKKDASTKLNKSTSFTDSNAFSKASASQRRHLCELDVGTNSEKSCSLSNKRQETLSRDVFDDDSPDFGATIDEIRDIQKRLNSMTANDKDSNKSRHGNYSLMQDNFDDIIANVDTEALLEDNTQTKDLQLIRDSRKRLPQIEKPSEPGRSTACFRSSDKDTVTCQSNSSDKENRYRAAEKVYESESDDDRTLTEYRSVSSSNAKKDSSEKDKLLDRLRPVESTSKDLKNSIHDVYEHDSLMDITQHYLIMKQFEEDLFDKASNSKGAEMEKLTKERTPPQKLKSTNVEGFNSKDAEHSGEEDDIVENTPDTKTRSIQPTSIASKRSSTSSPISSMNKRRSAASPSSVAERSTSTNTTPTRKKDVPMYQSTPRARALEKSNYVAAVCTGEKKLDPATSASKFADKQTKGVAGKSARTFAGQRFCFVCSGLLATQIENVKRLAQIVNARYVTQFDQEVTHVIVKVNPKDNGTNKTLKYLQGVVYRKWIVGYQWVIDSLAQRRLVQEEPYEAVDCSTLEAGPRNSRLSKKGLFEGFAFLCFGPYVDVSVEQYQELLRATGATVVDSLDALAAEKRRLKVIAIPMDVHDDEIIIGWYKKARAVPIVYEWVVECISQYKLSSFYRYLQELSQQDVRELGYPEFLLEEDADEDCDSA